MQALFTVGTTKLERLMTEELHEKYVHWLQEEGGSGEVDGPFFDKIGIHYTKRIYMGEDCGQIVEENDPVPMPYWERQADGTMKSYFLRRYYPSWGRGGPFVSLMRNMYETQLGLEAALEPLQDLHKCIYNLINSYREIS